MSKFKIQWHDRRKWPKREPNPDYPDGTDIDGAMGQLPSCKVDLPYPAKRIGVYTIICNTCGFSAACTTAGRPDDPRSMTLPCKESNHERHYILANYRRRF